MPYRIVEGRVALFYTNDDGYHRGSRPDGDSVWFKPNNPVHLQNIGNRNASLNAGGFAQLRFEGIDALELHYGGDNHQRENPTVASRDFMIAALGFAVQRMEYAPKAGIDTYVRDSDPNIVTAHILTRTIDLYGRPVAFLFPGTHPRMGGSSHFLDVVELDGSINARLMQAGLVYPGYYSARMNGDGGLPGSLRRRLSELKDAAAAAGNGLWPNDESRSGIRPNSEADLEDLAIWPKLYRRLYSFFDDDTATHTMNGFIRWLQADSSERNDLMFVLSQGELRHFSDVLTVQNGRLRMDFAAEDLIVVPR